MSSTLLFGTYAAALLYVLIPGPAFLQLLGIGAGQGRKAGALFVTGHLAGDLVWTTLALVAIVGARSIGPFIFDLLGLGCGLYLAWIGWSALTARPEAGASGVASVRRPFRRGLVFGLTNPKGYPVALATFTALVAGSADALSFAAFPALLTVSFAGFVTADILLVSMIGAGVVRRFYRTHERLIVRCSGVLFLGFAAQAILHAAPGLLGLRRA